MDTTNYSAQRAASGGRQLGSGPGKSGRGRVSSSIVGLLTVPIVAYRRLVSPLIAPRCRYYPTCSTYALEAIRTYGAARGLVLAIWRLLRCNPFSAGGFDPVGGQSLFRNRPGRHRADAGRKAHMDDECCGKGRSVAA